MIQTRVSARLTIAILSGLIILTTVGVCDQLFASDKRSSTATSQATPDSATQCAESFSAALRAAAQSVRPALVSIHSCKAGPLPAVSWSPIVPGFIQNDSFVSLDYPAIGDTTGDAVVEEFLGSGLILDADGLAVTSHKTVEGVRRVRVKTVDKQEYSAKVIKSDAESGVALLKIEGSNFPIAPLSSSGVLVGDWVAAVGVLPDGETSLSAGIISAQDHRSDDSDVSRGVMMTDATVDMHNNGGALVNLKGEVVGINTLIRSRQKDAPKFSFAIALNRVRSIIGSPMTAKATEKSQSTVAARAVRAPSTIKAEVPAAWQDLATRVSGLFNAMAERLAIKEWLRSSLERTHDDSKTSAQTRGSD